MMEKFFKKCWFIMEYSVRFLLQTICRLFDRDLSEDFFCVCMQFIRFGIVGLSNVVVSYSLYLFFLTLFQRFGLFMKGDYVVAQSISFLLSVLWSFYWNNKVVFAEHGEEDRIIWKSLIKAVISYSFTGLFINNILLIFFVQVLRITEFGAPIICLIIVVPLNFLISKFWTFNGK